MSEGLWGLRVPFRNIIVFLIVSMACLAVWSSDSYVACQQDQEQQARAEQEEKGTSFLIVTPNMVARTEFRCTGAFIDANSDNLVAIFTIVLAFSTILLWRETERLAEGAADQSRQMTASINATNRVADETAAANISAKEIGRAQVSPYLSIVEATFQINAWGVSASVHYKNFGTTPALTVRLKGELYVYFATTDEARTRPFVVPAPAIASSAVEQGGLMWPKQTLPEKLRSYLYDKSFPIAVEGEMTWHDVFGRRHAAVFHLSDARFPPTPPAPLEAMEGKFVARTTYIPFAWEEKDEGES